jgi:hypothetical protein
LSGPGASALDEDRDIGRRVGDIDWRSLGGALDAQGWATTGPLLAAAECRSISDLYPDESRFRSHVVMARHGYGELVLTEQRPRMQSRPDVVPLGRGEGAVFAVRQRPVQGRRGTYRVTMRHGVSRVRTGHRYTLGVIFHDAR